MKSLKALMGIVVSLAALPVTQAGMIQVSGTEMVAGKTVLTNYDDDKWWTCDWELSDSGLLELTVSGSESLWDGNTVYGFCSQYVEDWSDYGHWSWFKWVETSEDYAVTDVALATEKYPAPGAYLDADKAAALSELWGAYYDKGWQTDITDDDEKNAAAFQICVWEIIADYSGQGRGLDLGNGDFKIDSDISDIANGWLNSIPTLLDDDEDGAELRILKNDDYQNFLVEVKSTPVPEPATVVLLLTAIPGVLARRRQAMA